jgi:hypothetical protein
MTGHDGDLRAALRRLPAPELGTDLLPGILHSRGMGARLTLPRRRRTVPWGQVAAAVLILAFIVGSWKLSLSFSRMGESRSNRERVKEFLRGTIPWASTDEERPLLDRPPEPKFPLISGDSLDMSRLVEGTWTYRSHVTTDEVLTEQSGYSGVRLTRVTLDGRAAWMLNTSDRDTTYFDASSLRLRQSVYSFNKNRTRVVQSFSGDSATESMDFSGPMHGGYREAIALPFPPETFFINGWPFDHIAVLMPALPLTREWRGSLYQVAFISRIGIRGVSPMDMRVVGRDRVSVAAGSFDCWRLEVDTYFGGHERQTVWVSRDKGWVIKVQSDVASDVVVTRALESYEPGS